MLALLSSQLATTRNLADELLDKDWRLATPTIAHNWLFDAVTRDWHPDTATESELIDELESRLSSVDLLDKYSELHTVSSRMGQSGSTAEVTKDKVLHALYTKLSGAAGVADLTTRCTLHLKMASDGKTTRREHVQKDIADLLLAVSGLSNLDSGWSL
jgi:hypothetical protein